jgi:large subunit ribosomal protein LP2
MKHLAAYLLLGLGGNSSPSAKDIKKVLASVGIEADNDRLKALIDELKDKDINEVGPSARFGPHSDVGHSSSPRVRASSRAFRQAARAAARRPRTALLLAVTAARPSPRRRRKRRRRSPTKTWALGCSIRR